jgi:HK97 family phage major capsid protein
MADEIKDAVEAIESKIKEFKADMTESQKKELKKYTDELEKERKEFKAKVDELNLKVAEKEGTLGDIQQEVKELKAKSGRFRPSAGGKYEGLRNTIADGIAQGIAERKADIMKSASGELMTPHEIKTVADISSSNLTTANYISMLDWTTGMEPTGQFHFRNLLNTILSDTDFVQFPRANVPIGEGSFGRQATENTAKRQVDRDYTMVNLTLLPMAAFAICSRQSLRNIIFLQSWLPQSMMNQMEESEDTDFANALVAAATGSTTTTKTVAAEKIISYLKNLIQGKFNPNGVAVDPDVWEDFLSFRPGTNKEMYSLPFVAGVTPSGQVTVLGRPVYPVNWLTGRRVLVGDWTKAAIVQSEGLRLRQSDSHASIFTSNEIAFLLERTEGLAIFRPDAFITTTV